MTGDVVGGYRLVRSLGEGTRAEVYLGHPIVAPETSPQVALKIYRAGVPFADIERELHALTTAAGPHVVSVLDISTGIDGSPVLVLERVSGRSLASLLAARGTLSIGEAITVLVPLAGAVGRIRAAGIAHTRIGPGSVFFTNDGAPVLACFGGSAVTKATNSLQREASDALGADLADFRDVARVVVLAAHGSATDPALMQLMQWMDAAPLDDGFVDELIARLFEVGTPEPVQLSAEVVAPAPDVRTGLQQARRRAGSHDSTLGRSAIGALTGALARLDRLPDLVARAKEIIAPVRARFWVIGLGALATMVLALVVVPQNPSDAISGATPSPASSATPTSTRTPIPSISEPDNAADVTGDDPAAALDALLAVRDECIRSASILCLDGVGQVGSAALAEDQERIRSLQGAPDSIEEVQVATIPDTPREFQIEEQLGGAALVTVTGSNSEPASVLMIRSEAGWRIRDYLT